MEKRPVNYCECGNHAWVELTKGFVSLFSPEEGPYLGRWNWCVKTEGRNWYAIRKRGISINGVKHKFDVAMHRVLLPLPHGWTVDHRNGNGLDNRKDNLRPATVALNNQNQKPRNTSSPYKGVAKAQGKWRAAISVGGQFYYLGNHETQEAAARAYDAKAVELLGEYARLNFPDEHRTRAA